MDTKISDHSTPSKNLRRHDKFGHSTFNSDSPFRFLHNYKTPESKLSRVKNPFEPLIHEKLHTHFFSPSVFTKTSSSNSEENFKWTIDEMSHIKPVDIDEHAAGQYCTPESDSAVESLAQSRIDKFFSMKEIVPSPYAQPIMNSPLITGTPMTPSPCKGQMVDNTSQTVLTLPPKLPRELEEALKPFFTYTHDQQDGEAMVNSSLQRKLFDIDENDESCSEQSSPARSINLNLSPPKFPVFGPGGCIRFSSDASPRDDFLEHCVLSPVVSNEGREKSRIRMESNHHMSVDLSFNVPEVGDSPPLQENSLNLDSTKSSLKEALSDSTVNWDMEYKQIVSANNSSAEEMDVSNSNTPKSKIFISQRKNLSNSFREELPVDEGDKLKSALTDTGYQTGYGLTTEDSTWNTSNFIASTPTKQKLFS